MKLVWIKKRREEAQMEPLLNEPKITALKKSVRFTAKRPPRAGISFSSIPAEMLRDHVRSCIESKSTKDRVKVNFPPGGNVDKLTPASLKKGIYTLSDVFAGNFLALTATKNVKAFPVKQQLLF